MSDIYVILKHAKSCIENRIHELKVKLDKHCGNAQKCKITYFQIIKLLKAPLWVSFSYSQFKVS